MSALCTVLVHSTEGIGLWTWARDVHAAAA